MFVFEYGVRDGNTHTHTQTVTTVLGAAFKRRQHARPRLSALDARHSYIIRRSRVVVVVVVAVRLWSTFSNVPRVFVRDCRVVVVVNFLT